MVIDGVRLPVRDIAALDGNEAADAVQIGNETETDGGDGSRAYGADVLGAFHHLNGMSGNVGQDLGGHGGEGASAYETDGIGDFDFPGFTFQHPAQMVADAFEDSADELGLSGLQADTEEHAGGCGILEGTAVAVEPGVKRTPPEPAGALATVSVM